MLTALLGATAAALFGSADFLGGFASKRSPALLVTTVMYGVAVVVTGGFVFILRPEHVGSGDMVWSVSSGVFGAIGVLSLYAALAIGRMGVVAPLTAALGGAGPAAFDLLRGSQIQTPALVGMLLALVAVVVVSTNTGNVEEHGMPPRAVLYSIVAGSAFACSVVSLSLTTQSSGYMPLLIARVVGLGMFLAAVFLRRGTLVVDRSAVRIGAAAGALDAGAMMTMLAAIRVGPLAVAAVVGGLYPVATMLLARSVLGERLKRHQVAGAVLALAAVVLTALP